MSQEELNSLRAIWLARRDQPIPTVAEARRNFEIFMAAMPIAADIEFQEIHIGDRAAAWLTPPGASLSRTLLFFHGGGFVIGNHKTHRGLAGDLAKAAGTRALSIDYRLAPEHPFPAALDDCLAAYRWLLEQGVSADSIVLAGDSAGGNLVISCLAALRDSGAPLPRGACLFSPWVDLALAGDSFESKAAADPRMTRQVLQIYQDAYLAGRDAQTPLASPLYARLGGLPPFLIQVGSDELLLDDATRLATRAAHAGVKVRLDVWPAMVHVWQAYAPMLSEGRQAIEEAGRFLADLLVR
ncbi:alpha/beta hydrolase [Telmatospirillum siberiense]|uniref:Alpha/beta hydrolase n=1 Tax=Telmatospirillum siberiense TaxID=382514 RepID=A0A2N3PYK1_9PROT|nr:alpha/beta hydrolase [Telmatospirillum siberiense]PKU25496.1 alpha/beta hydrolase [Telmatospirillum siberiense]